MKTFLVCVCAVAVLFSGAAVIQYQSVIKNLSFDKIPVVESVFKEVSDNSVVVSSSTTRSLMD